MKHKFRLWYKCCDCFTLDYSQEHKVNYCINCGHVHELSKYGKYGYYPYTGKWQPKHKITSN